jgi:hypothetical protein
MPRVLYSSANDVSAFEHEIPSCLRHTSAPDIAAG